MDNLHFPSFLVWKSYLLQKYGCFFTPLNLSSIWDEENYFIYFMTWKKYLSIPIPSYFTAVEIPDNTYFLHLMTYKISCGLQRCSFNESFSLQIQILWCLIWLKFLKGFKFWGEKVHFIKLLTKYFMQQ